MEQVCVKNFLTEMEAELAKNMLEASGIKCAIQKDAGNIAKGAGVGTGLFVLEKDLEEARELLDIK